MLKNILDCVYEISRTPTWKLPGAALRLVSYHSSWNSFVDAFAGSRQQCKAFHGNYSMSIADTLHPFLKENYPRKKNISIKTSFNLKFSFHREILSLAPIKEKLRKTLRMGRCNVQSKNRQISKSKQESSSEQEKVQQCLAILQFCLCDPIFLQAFLFFLLSTLLASPTQTQSYRKSHYFLCTLFMIEEMCASSINVSTHKTSRQKKFLISFEGLFRNFLIEH